MQPDGNQPTTSRVTVQEAARALGVTVEAIRGRIKRGTLRSTKAEDGNVFVFIPATDQTNGQTRPADDQPKPDANQPGPDADHTQPIPDQTELVHVLRELLEDERAANRENRRIIAMLASRVPELEPAKESPQKPRNGHETVSENAGNGEAQPEPEKRSWWRRLFG